MNLWVLLNCLIFVFGNRKIFLSPKISSVKVACYCILKTDIWYGVHTFREGVYDLVTTFYIAIKEMLEYYIAMTSFMDELKTGLTSLLSHLFTYRSDAEMKWQRLK